MQCVPQRESDSDDLHERKICGHIPEQDGAHGHRREIEKSEGDCGLCETGEIFPRYVGVLPDEG